MKFFLPLILTLTLSSCSITQIENATIDNATFNAAAWKSQAGIGGAAVIEATTSPSTDLALPLVP